MTIDVLLSNIFVFPAYFLNNELTIYIYACVNVRHTYVLYTPTRAFTVHMYILTFFLIKKLDNDASSGES